MLNLAEITQFEIRLVDLLDEMKRVKKKKEQLQRIEERLADAKNEVRDAQYGNRSLEDLAIMQGLFERMLKNVKRSRSVPKVVEQELLIIKEIKDEKTQLSLPPLL